MTDQKSTDSPGDGRRAPAAATAADPDTDTRTPRETQAERRQARLNEIVRRADEETESDKAKAKRDKEEAREQKKKAREQKKAERAERRQQKLDDRAEKSEPADRLDKPKGKGAKPAQGFGGQVSAGVSAVRNRIAPIVWLIAVLCAVILALGALLAALSDNINESNPVVEFINETAHALDGPFGNLITFDGRDDRTKEILVNWGLAALAYLIVGRILDRLIRA